MKYALTDLKKSQNRSSGEAFKEGCGMLRQEIVPDIMWKMDYSREAKSASSQRWWALLQSGHIKNWEEEINLSYLKDKSAQVCELNLWNKEMGSMNIILSLHYESRKCDEGWFNDTNKDAIEAIQFEKISILSRWTWCRTKHSKEKFCPNLEIDSLI